MECLCDFNSSIVDFDIMSNVQTVRHGGQSPARSIGLAILICVYAVATVLMGTLNPFPFFFACYAFGDYVFFLIYYRRLLGLSAPAFRRSARWIAGVTPVACLALLLAFL